MVTAKVLSNIIPMWIHNCLNLLSYNAVIESNRAYTSCSPYRYRYV